MKMELTFRWDGEDARPSPTQLKRIMDYADEDAGNWVTTANFLQDVVYESTRAYNRFLEQRSIPKGYHG